MSEDIAALSGSCPALSAGPARSLQAVVVALVLVLANAAAVTGLPRADRTGTAPFVLVFPPWTSATDAANASLAAGYEVLRGGAWPFVTIVASPGPDASVIVPLMAIALKLGGLAGCLDGARLPDAKP